MTDQPVDSLHWIPADSLTANDYNPNYVAKPELRLLKVSILEDGWTQPLVINEKDEIIDGFHRWTLVVTDKEVAAMTDGLVPVVVVVGKDEAGRKMSTVRHNRARGNHRVLAMAEIVRSLHESGMGKEEIQQRLQMEEEEVERLLDASTMPDFGGTEFTRGWVPH